MYGIIDKVVFEMIEYNTSKIWDVNALNVKIVVVVVVCVCVCVFFFFFEII